MGELNKKYDPTMQKLLDLLIKLRTKAKNTEISESWDTMINVCLLINKYFYKGKNK